MQVFFHKNTQLIHFYSVYQYLKYMENVHIVNQFPLKHFNDLYAGFSASAAVSYIES